MERSAIREIIIGTMAPDFASLHPGYENRLLRRFLRRRLAITQEAAARNAALPEVPIAQLSSGT